MAKTTILPVIRALGIVLIVLWSLGMKAQTASNPVLTWDQEVGCIEYDDKGEKERYTLLEQIKEGFCIRVCEGTLVNYNFSADGVVNVEWQANGGTVQSSSNTGAAIQWGSNGNGSLTLIITYDDNTVETLTICVEKVISPKAYFEIDGPEPDQREFCTFIPISFNNLSNDNGGSAIVNYLWDFGDGTTSSLFEPTHAYDNPGTYTIVLTVTNSCNCSSYYKWDVNITEAKEFEISCPSVVCEGAHETYSVNDGCGGGEWKVVGGDLVADYGTSIEVVWNQVDPAEGFGYVSYRSDCSCPFWNTVKIPVVLRRAIIQGPMIICQGDQGRYTLPQWPTTEFEWMINGDPFHPMLVHTEHRNEIVVDGADPGDYVLSVNYRNTLIDDGNCTGYAEMRFTVSEKPVVLTDDELNNCQGTNMTFYTQSGQSAEWIVQLNGTTIHNHIGSSMDYDFPNAGTHVITAGSAGCMSDPVTVEIVETPIITGSISGESNVCLETPYTYTLSEEEPGYIYVWSVDNGAVIGNNTGAQADIQFSSSPATVTVVKQIVSNGITCESEPIEFTVTEVNINPIINNNSGLSEFCPSSTAQFTVDLGGVVADHITWSIRSSTNATNFGSIINGINGTTATVGFNEISTSATGILQVDVVKCGQTFSKTYVINLIEDPVLTIGTIDDVCPLDTGQIPVPITVTPMPTTNPVEIEVLIDGVYQDTYTYSGGGFIYIDNNFGNNSNSNISRTVTLQLELCSYSSSVSQNVIVYPETEVYISPDYTYVVCPTSYGSIDLTSTVSTGITSSTTFTWFKGSVQQQTGTSPNFSITGPNPGGVYHVKVIDVNGCLVQSDNIYVTEHCGGDPGPGGCTISPDPNASISAVWSDCNEITGSTSWVYAPTSITWTGSTHLTLVSGQGTDTPIFTTTVPGAHVVTAYMDYSGCTIARSYTVEKNYEAKLSTEITCNGDGTYNVTLHNHSLTYNAGTLTKTYSQVGGPTIPSDPGTSGNSATISSVGPGTYTYSMDVSSPGNQPCTATVTVTLDPEPDTVFDLDPEYCSDEPVTLSIPGGYIAGNTYEWSFNDTSFFASGTDTEIQFAESDTYAITLTVTTPYGCIYISDPVNVLINAADFEAGTIVPDDGDFCDNSSVIPLSYEVAPFTIPPTDIIWMKGNVQVGTGLTYQPTESGSYWPVLIDNNGCKSYVMATEAVNYILRQPPFASISGNTSACFGEDITLFGVITDDTAEHRWVGPSLPSGYGNWVSGNTNLVLDLSGLATGTHTFEFEVRAGDDPLCSTSFSTTIEVHPQVVAPTISYTVSNCDPYTIQLTASGPSTGTYNWSNGMTGQSIEVTYGGAYSVTYTETTGCSATGYAQTPHNPERALWIVPEGCYTVCDAYLLGPLGTYDHYNWEINSVTSQSGSNTSVPNQPITTGGAYQLFLGQQICNFGSNIPTINIDVERCPQQPCNLKAVFELMEIIPGGFMYYVGLTNPTGSPIAVHLSSFNGYGTFVPSVLVLNPGFNSFVVEFYVNGTYTPGVPDMFVVSGPDCQDVVDVRLPETHGLTLVEPASLVLSPNPSHDTTVVTYSTGTEYDNAQSIKVYDIMGMQRYNEKVSGTDGNITLDVSRFIPGTYIITLEADGKRIATEKLIKK